MNQSAASEPSRGDGSSGTETQSSVLGLWGVRYQVKDMTRSVAFYTQQLGFRVDRQNHPFPQVSIGNRKLILGGAVAT